jgi:diaminopropionate ammonia-lyase
VTAAGYPPWILEIVPTTSTTMDEQALAHALHPDWRITEMFVRNEHRDHGRPLQPDDAAVVGTEAADEVERYLARRPDHVPTPLHHLPGLAGELGIGSIHCKDEGERLGLGSFKALGGSYAVIRLVMEEAERQVGRRVDVAELRTPRVRAVAEGFTFGCATDGNHGRSVAAGARMVGARAVIFVHEHVSLQRIAAIQRFGAEVIRVGGTYDDTVAEAARRCTDEGWTVVSDTSWPGYERIPGLVMQGYTALIREALEAIPHLPTHVFVQAGVGGLAAAVAGHMMETLGERRPRFIVVEPARAACVLESARAGRPVRIPHGAPTVMAMLECYEPSFAAWRILSHAADAFMTVDEEDAVAIMRRLALPSGGDPPIVAGESGGVGLAGLARAVADAAIRTALALDGDSRVLVINTEGATDPDRYRELVGAPIDEIMSGGTL